MKMLLHLVLALLGTFFLSNLNGQETAITSKGDTVLLYSDGTWNYLNGDLLEDAEGQQEILDMEIPYHQSHYKTPASAQDSITGKNKSFAIHFNSNLWEQIPAKEINESAEVVLKYKPGFAWLMVIYEEPEIELKHLVQIALDNAKSVATEMQIDEVEYRTVNDSTLIFMQLSGEINGMKVTYYSYYYSNPFGSVQVITFTGQKQFPEYKADMQDLLNGFQILK